MNASRTLVCLVVAFLSAGLFNPCLGAEVVTLTLDAPASTNSYSQAITLAQGDTAVLTAVSGGGADNNIQSYMKVEVTIGALTFLECPWLVSGEGAFTVNPIKVAGPVTLRVCMPSSYIFPSKAWATFDITRANSADNVIPANAVVIPEDAGGQFQVILESSTDLITWTAATPGTYGGSTTKRFFRTRIVRN